MDWKHKETKVENIVKVLTYIISIIAFSIVYRYISPIYSISFITLFLISIYFDVKDRYYINRWIVNISSLIFVGLLILRINLNDPIVPLVETLLILLGLKLIEKKRYRDYMQIYTISVFLLAGSSLLSVSIIFIFYLLSLLFLITTSVIFLSYFSAGKGVSLENRVIVKIFLKTSLIPLLSIPFTIAMFIILPRTNYPILNFLNQQSRIKTGFSDSVSLGDVSSIQEDSSLIFRAKVKKIKDNQLYWRGFVFDYFDGKKWSKSKNTDFYNVDVKGERIKQIIYLEPYGSKYLFSLDKPVYIYSNQVDFDNNFSFWTENIPFKKIKYEAVSVLTDKIYQEEINTKKYLQLPEKFSPRLRNLVKEFSIGKSQREIIQFFYQFLNSPDFHYSLSNIPKSENPVEDFIFKYKRGNCEYFASSLAVMLRLAGIPARLVAGYRGGYYNDIGQYYIVLQKNAHIWVEAYIDGYWLRLDPTPASAEFFTGFSRKNILFKISVLFDTINYYWTEMVINYNFQKQVSFFKNAKNLIKKPESVFHFEKKQVSNIGIILIVLILIVFIFRIKNLKKDTETALIEKFLKKMEKYNYKKEKNEGLEEFVNKIKEQDLKKKAIDFIKLFEGRFYKDNKLSKEDIKKLKQILKDI